MFYNYYYYYNTLTGWCHPRDMYASVFLQGIILAELSELLT